MLVVAISTIENDFCHSFRPFKLFVKPLHEVLYLLGLTAAPTVKYLITISSRQRQEGMLTDELERAIEATIKGHK